MAAGTLHAVAAVAGGGIQLAYHGTNGDLWVSGPHGPVDTGLGLAQGTSPSIAGLSTGGYEVAFQANGSNTLYVYGPAGTGNTGLGLASGTSPTITALT